MGQSPWTDSIAPRNPPHQVCCLVVLFFVFGFFCLFVCLSACFLWFVCLLVLFRWFDGWLVIGLAGDARLCDGRSVAPSIDELDGRPSPDRIIDELDHRLIESSMNWIDGWRYRATRARQIPMLIPLFDARRRRDGVETSSRRRRDGVVYDTHPPSA